MILVLSLLAFAAWLYLLGGRGGFWRSGPVLESTTPTRPYQVTVVVPARDEVNHVLETLQSLLSQEFGGSLRVVLVDDNSSDGTGDLARSMHHCDPRLQVLAGEPLPAGWTGKMWAVAQGLRQPEARGADYILLTDADVVHRPGHVASLVAKAENENLDLVSEMVRLRSESLAEQALIPAFVFFFQMLYPFRWVGDAARSTAAAAGGTMLVSRAALDRVNDIERIRGELIDDVALASEIKRGGYRIWLGHGEKAESQRTYPGFADIWQMIARTAYVQLRYSPLLLVGTCLGMLLMYMEPVWLAISAQGLARWVGLVCWSMMAVAFQPTLRRYRRSPIWGLALPAIALFYLSATVGSAVRFYGGHGSVWKDRTYPKHSAAKVGGG